MPTALQNYLDHLGLPIGILPSVSDTYKAMNSRIMLIDNCAAMGTVDSHLLKADCNFERIEKTNKVSRWTELSQCVKFHAKMASRCWIPTEFRLVNEYEGMPKEFGICRGKPDEVRAEREHVINAIKNVNLDANANPLASRIREIERTLSGKADELKHKNGFVSVIICTHGVPTNETGDTVKSVIKDFVESLMSLAQLPVRTTFRLCTGNDKVVDFFSLMEAEIECCVLQDYWGEASKVYLHNPWLTYGIGIHRLREAVLGTKLMRKLNKEALSLDEIRKFCQDLFVGKKPRLRNPRKDFDGFIEDLKYRVEREKATWNPVKNKLSPWIDVNKLHSIYQRYAADCDASAENNIIRRDATTNTISSALIGGTFLTSRTMKQSRCSLMRRSTDRDVVKTADPPELFRLDSCSSSRLTNRRVTNNNTIKVSFNECCISSPRKTTNIPISRPNDEKTNNDTATTDIPELPKQEPPHAVIRKAKKNIDKAQTHKLSSVHSNKQAANLCRASFHCGVSYTASNTWQQKDSYRQSPTQRVSLNSGAKQPCIRKSRSLPNILNNTRQKYN